MNSVTLRAVEKLALFAHGIDYCRMGDQQAKHVRDIYMGFVIRIGTVHGAQRVIDEMCADE